MNSRPRLPRTAVPLNTITRYATTPLDGSDDRDDLRSALKGIVNRNTAARTFEALADVMRELAEEQHANGRNKATEYNARRFEQAALLCDTLGRK